MSLSTSETRVVVNDGWIKPLARHSYASRVIKYWKEILRLQKWTVGISQKSPLDAHYMEIKIYPRRLKASIRIHEQVWTELDEIEFNKTILHELLHITFDPIRQENYKQVKGFTTFKDRKAEYDERMLDQIEVAVEDMTQVVYSLHSHSLPL